MADRRRLGWLGALLAGALILTGCGSGPEEAGTPGIQTVDNGGWNGAHLDTPYVIPPIALDDTDGKPFTLATSEAPLKIVFYGYTKCPDICQIMMSTIASALTRLGNDRGKVEVVFVTTDPPRDTGPVLREYLDRFDKGFVGLTGELPTIMQLAKPMKVFIADGKKLPSGGYEVDHSTYVFGVTGDKADVIWTQGTSPAEMAADMIKLLKS